MARSPVRKASSPPPPLSLPPVPPPSSLAPAVMKKASLYVGDLHPDVTQLDLTILFSRIGPLDSVRLCRDRQFPYKSLCYAYINFIYPVHACKALAILNHYKFKGKSMRIMWTQRNPLVRKTGVANLFVKNLDSSVTSARLQTIFSKFGVILSCKVAEENGKSKCFGFVQFDSEESALAAIAGLHNNVLDGKKIYVSKFVKKSERKDVCEESKFTNLFVKNLEKNMTEDILKGTFSEYGNVCSVSIMKDNEGISKGFGFVEFKSHEEAKKAMLSLNGTLIGSKKLYVGKAETKAESAAHLRRAYKEKVNFHTQRSKDSNLYVKYLNFSIDDRKLKQIFSAFGGVTSAKVMRHDNGFSKGFGFVSFSNPEAAKKAMESLNGTIVEGRYLYVAVAQCKEERSKGLQIYFSQLQPQSLYTNWNVLASPFHSYNYSNPFFPTPVPASPMKTSQLPTNQCLSSYRGLSYSFGAYNYQGHHSTYIPVRCPEQGTSTTGERVYQDHPGHTEEVSTVHLGTNKSSVQKIPPMAEEVGKALKLRQAPSLSYTNGRIGPAKSARCLSY